VRFVVGHESRCCPESVVLAAPASMKRER